MPRLTERRPSRYWLCFDVGLTSSYERLYAWLDDHQAEECADNVATFSHPKDFDSVAAELLEALQKDNGRGTRLYLIGLRRSTQGGIGVGGKFISGKRKANPWHGFGGTSGGEEDEG